MNDGWSVSSRSPTVAAPRTVLLSVVVMATDVGSCSSRPLERLQWQCVMSQIRHAPLPASSQHRDRQRHTRHELRASSIAATDPPSVAVRHPVSETFTKLSRLMSTSSGPLDAAAQVEKLDNFLNTTQSLE